MKFFSANLLLVLLSLLLCTKTLQSQQSKNILILVSDDFNSWMSEIGYYPQARTPNLDALSRKGVLFSHTYSPSPVCNPSRNAMMSGYRPNTTELYRNSEGYIRGRPGFSDIKTLNQYFSEQSYYTYAGGKIYHPTGMGSVESDAVNWSGLYTDGIGSPGGDLVNWEANNHANLGWSIGEFDLNTAGDTKLANHMAQFVQNYSPANHEGKPFLAAVGFYRPHLPWHVHRQFWDMYDEDTLDLPQGYLVNDLDDHVGQDTSLHHEIVSAGKWKEGIHAYLAGISYADYNVGIVLDALENSPHKDNTVIVFLGDHGWHLGEKSIWDKAHHYQRAYHTSFVIYDPSAEGNGTKCLKPVSLQDLYPTLVEIAGLEPKTDIEGESLVPLLADPQDPMWSRPVIMTNRGNTALRTEEYRLFEHPREAQLYRVDVDPWEFHNLYSQPGYGSIVDSLNDHIAQINQVGQDLKAKLNNNYQFTPSLNILPGIVEGENYDEGVNKHTYFDKSSGNAGAEFRGDNVDIYSEPGASNGYFLGELEDEEWLNYTLYNTPSALYHISFRISNVNVSPGQQIEVFLGTKSLGVVPISGTSSTNDWAYVTLPNIYINTQNSRIFKVLVKEGNFQLDHIKFDLSDSSVCTDEPDVLISPAGPFPADDTPQQLNGTPTGGIWTGAISASGIFDPSIGEGFHEVYYSVNFGNGCIKSDTLTIEVTAPSDPCFLVEDVEISSSSPFYSDEGIQQLTASPSGGTWSGSANSDGTFDPSQGVGSYPVFYTVDFGNGCMKADTVFVEVMEPIIGGECTSPTNLALGMPTSQSSVRGNGVPSIAVDGDTEGTGNNWVANPKITHTQPEPQPWWEVDLGEIADIEQINIFNRTSCCMDRLKEFYVLVSTQPFNHVASLTEILNTPNTNSLFIAGPIGTDTSIPFSTIGRYVRIQLTSGNPPLHMAEVQVMGCIQTLDPCEGQPAVMIDPAGPFITDAGLQQLTADPSGGIWSGSVNSEGTFDPSQGVGFYSVVYTVDFGNGCMQADTISIEVTEPIDPCDEFGPVLITPAGPFLSNQPIQTLLGSPAGGIWGGDASSEGTFDPSQGEGTYIVTYAVDFGDGCMLEDRDTIVVNPAIDPCLGQPEVGIDPAGPFSTDAGIQQLTANPLGGLWSGSANTDGSFDPSQGAGFYPVIYTVDFGNGCIKADTIDIQVTQGSCTATNLALNQNASQSSTRGNGIADIAVDGDTEGTGNNWVESPKIIHTQTEQEPWWQVDLGQEADIEQVNVYNRTSCCLNRLKDFYILVSSQPFGSNSLNDLLNSPDVQSTFIAGEAGAVANIPFVVSGKYVRLQLTSTNQPLHIAEVQVMGCPSEGSDPCAGQASVSIDPAGPFTMDQGIQQLSANPSGGTWSGAANTDGSFDPSQGVGSYTVTYTVDFGNGCVKFAEASILVNGLVDPCTGQPDVSIDPAGPFTTDQGIQQLSGNPSGGSWSGSVDSNGNFDPSQGADSYPIIYTVDFGNGCVKADTMIVEVNDPSTGEECNSLSNLALGQTTQQSSTKGNGTSSVAVDGNTDGDGNHWGANPKITHTQNDPEAWWEVDLGQQADIQQIHIYNRTSCCRSRLKDFYVLVSEDPFDNSASLTDLLNTPQIHSFFYSGEVDEEANISFAVSGRFVRIQLTSSNQPLHIAEVQVLGCYSGSSGLRFDGTNRPLGNANEASPKRQLILFPNPVDEESEVILKLESGPADIGNLEILNSVGKRVAIYKNLKLWTPVRIPISDLSSGIYLFRIYGGGWELSERVIKE